MAIDGNIYTTDSASADYVNPDFWSSKLQKGLKQEVFLEQFGRRDLRSLGRNHKKIYIPTSSYDLEASKVADGSSIGSEAFSYGQIEVTFDTYATSVAISTKQLVSSFEFLMPDVKDRLQYGLKKKKEKVIRDALYSDAGLSYYANQTTESTIGSSDTLDFTDIVWMKSAMSKKNAEPKYLIISPEGRAQLEETAVANGASYKRENIIDMDKYVRTFNGIDVYATNFIDDGTVNTDVPVWKNLMLGMSNGQAPFAVAYQEFATMKIGEDSILDLQTRVAAYEIYGVAVTESDGVMVAYSAKE